METHFATSSYAATVNPYAQARQSGGTERPEAAPTKTPPVATPPAENGKPPPVVNMQGQKTGSIVNTTA